MFPLEALLVAVEVYTFFSREFGVLDSFKSIAGGSSRGVSRGDRVLFGLSSKSLSSWLNVLRHTI